MKINFKSKIPSVKFYGFNEEKQLKNSSNNYIVGKRIFVLIVLTVCLVLTLVCRFAYIQLFKADKLNVSLEQYGSKVYSLDAPRGEIVDRNGTVLVNNSNVICVTYYQPKSITKSEIESIASFLSKNININLDDVSLRNKKDYFISAHPELANKLVSAKEKKSYENDINGSAKIYKLKLERITEDMINQNMTQNEIEFNRFKFLMENNSSGSTVLAENISVAEASLIGERANVLKGIKVTNDWSRNYNTEGSFTQVLGKVTTKKQGIPSNLKDYLLAYGYNNDSRVGTSGIEAQYEDTLRGTNTTYTLKYDSRGYPTVVNKNTGSSGDNLRISIDWELQKYADDLISDELRRMNSSNKYFNKLFFTMMDPNSGEIIVMSGKMINKETGEVSDYAAGNYLDANKIGSTIKGGTLYTGFKYNVISPNTYLVDEPIYIKGTKVKKSWKTMGNINEVDALAYSSNVYMFKVGMQLAGVNYVPKNPLKINSKYFSILRNSLGELGLGVKTGIDIPNEQLGYHGSKTDSGLFLDACIGQYDTYTNLQLVQYASTLANGGKRIQPSLMKETFVNNSSDNTQTVLSTNRSKILDDVSNQSTAFTQIKQGMRACVTRSDGTCRTYWSSKPYTTFAKTGTAEDYGGGDGKTDYPNHLQIGYIAKDENSAPKMAFACVCIRQTNASSGSSSAPYISQAIMDKYYEKYGIN